MQPEEVIAGRFAIERWVGAGGMGNVFRARDRVTNLPVALKLIAAEHAERFSREAHALSQLEHPGIVRYIAHGESPGGFFLAMEWLDGIELSERLATTGVGIDDSVLLVRRAAEALALAHAKGIVHRDIKPSNLFLRGGEPDGLVVLDFGIARVDWAKPAVTGTGTAVGTPAYMAPEQARGDRDIDARIDVFALGCVLFECLTGRPAFAGEHVVAVLAKILFQEAPRVSSIRPDVPALLDALTMRMLAKTRTERPADGAAVVAELDATRAPAVTDRPAPPVITTGERRLLCVALGVPATESSTDETVAAEADRATAIRLQTIAAEHGARAELLANGSLVVTFSGTGVATDQASRAARCALELRAAWSGPLALATGLGEVAGSLPVGDAIDRAARRIYADRRAKSAGVLLDDATAGLLGASFELAAGDSGLTLRGVRSFGPPTARTLLGKVTSCVGRERELGLLEALFRECIEEPAPRAAIATGPPGVGKSRLAAELARRIRQIAPGAQVWIARADPMRIGAPFGLLAQLVRGVAGVLEGDAPGVQNQRLRARLTRGVPPDRLGRTAAFLSELLGAQDPDSGSPELRGARADPRLMGEEIRAAATELIAAECAVAPCVLLIEDMQWGDLPTVRFVDRALRSLSSSPLFVLALARPELSDVFPRLWAERDAQEIRIGGLSARAAEKLVREALPDARSDVVSRLVALAGGNVFYLEELIRAVAEGRGAELPGSVRAMAQTRFEQQGPEARRLLRAASVFGEVFWHAALSDLLGQPPDTLDVLLSELVEREVIEVRAAGKFVGERDYTFRHALLQEAAYASLIETDRSAAHKRAGAWLERVGETEALTLAEHFERGHDRPRALAAYVRAVDQAFKANDFRAVLDRSERALALTEDPATMATLRLARARARGDLGAWDLARAEGKQAAELSHGTTRAEAVVELARACFWDRDTSASLAHATEALTLARDVGRADLEADALGYVAASKPAAEADLAGALELYRRVREIAGETYVSSEVHSTSVLYWLGRNSELLAIVDTLVDAARRRGDVWALMQLLPHKGLACASLGRYRQAAALFDEARQLGEKHEIRTLLARSMAMSMGMHLDLGNYAGAEAIAQEAGELARSVGFAPARIATELDLLFAFARRGQVGRAEALVRGIAEDVRNAAGWHGWLWKLRFVEARAELALATGAWDSAVALATDCFEQSSKIGRAKYEALALTTRAHARERLGRPREALTDLDLALSAARRAQDSGAFLRAAAAKLALSGDDDALKEEANATAVTIRDALPPDLQECFGASAIARAVMT